MLVQNRKPYLLLTPGPLSTSPTVKQVMQYDSCTWDDDYKHVVSDIRQKLLKIANCSSENFTTVLMQGSGTFGVESVIGSCVNRARHKLLILVNGVYGQRIVEMAQILQLNHRVYQVSEDAQFDAAEIQAILSHDLSITHIVLVHCETTSGILNNLNDVAELAKKNKKYFIVDAMSSFGGIPFDITDLSIDFMISSSNKCLQGVPGFSFVICKTESLITLCKNQGKSLSLDLYAQWQHMETDAGKWRYTSPTHTVLAFHQALQEFFAEGGLEARAKRYRNNQRILASGMEQLGFETFIPQSLQSSIITTFLQPEYIPNTSHRFYFKEFYQYLKASGMVIYPGKVTKRHTFRIGTIGHVFQYHIENLLQVVMNFINEARAENY